MPGLFDGFYLVHRWKAFRRGPSSWQKVLFVLYLICFGIVIGTQINKQWLLITRALSKHLADSNLSIQVYGLIIIGILDLILKITLSKPIPPVHQYHLLSTDRRSLKIAYLISAVFSWWMLLLMAAEMALLARLFEEPFTALQLAGLFTYWMLSSFVAMLVFISDRGAIRQIVLLILFVLMGICYQYPQWIVVPVFSSFWLSFIGFAALVALTFTYNRLELFFGRVLRANTQSGNVISLNLSFVNNPLMKLELLSILRNKRARMSIIMAFVMIPYFLFMTGSSMKSEGFQTMISTLYSGIILFQMGIYIFAWEGSYFDLLMVNYSVKDFIWHKYRFFAISNFIFMMVYILSVVFVNPALVKFSLIGFLYNTGLNTPLIIFQGTKNTEKIDMNKSIWMNYQGFNMTIFLTTLLAMFMPMILVLILESWFDQTTCFLLVGMFGLVGIIFRKQIMSHVIKRLEARKYFLSQCYRS